MTAIDIITTPSGALMPGSSTLGSKTLRHLVS
jgi:hypothetical protein